MIITGFGPFGPPGSAAHEENPSEAIARAAGALVGARVDILPVSYAAVANLGRSYADADLVVSLGVAGGRTVPFVERQAVNWMEASIADHDGVRARGQRIDGDGPDVVTIEWDSERFGVGSSASAGTFVCNALAYSLYRHHRNACFIHVPPLEHLGVDEGADLVGRIIECSMSA